LMYLAVVVARLIAFTTRNRIEVGRARKRKLEEWEQD
jgi:hypothetical protein